MNAHHSPEQLVKIRSKKLMRAMKGYPCTLRISGFLPGFSCDHGSTVVGAHLEAPVRGLRMPGKGTSTKITDLAVAASCKHCHDLISGVDPRFTYLVERYPAAVMFRLLAGLVETHAMLAADGIITVDGGELI